VVFQPELIVRSSTTAAHDAALEDLAH
jgi:hypothetical protein